MLLRSPFKSTVNSIKFSVLLKRSSLEMPMAAVASLLGDLRKMHLENFKKFVGPKSINFLSFQTQKYVLGGYLVPLSHYRILIEPHWLVKAAGKMM